MDKQIKNTTGDTINKVFNKQFEISNIKEILKKEKEKKEKNTVK